MAYIIDKGLGTFALRFRWPFLILGIVHIVLALLLVPIYRAIVEAGKISMVTRYREMMAYGVINQEQLNHFRDGELASEITRVPNFLLGTMTHGIFGFSWIVALVLLATGIFLLVIWYHLHKSLQ